MKRLGYRFEDYSYVMDCGDWYMGVAVYKGKSVIGEVPMCSVEHLKNLTDEELKMWVEKNV